MAILNFDAKVGYYRNQHDNTGTVITLRQFLRACKNGHRRSDIERVWTAASKDERDALKEWLPRATLNGLFQPTRTIANLVEPSGFMTLDFDRQDNTEVTDSSWKRVREILSRSNYFAVIAKSVSGTGWWALVPLQYPDRFKEHFFHIARQLDLMCNLVVDPNCKAINMNRTIFYDPDIYVNERAVPYPGITHLPPRQESGLLPADRLSDKEIKENFEFAKFIVEAMIRSRCEFGSGTHDDWWRAAAAIAYNCGEEGRELFLRLARECGTKSKIRNSYGRYSREMKTPMSLSVLADIAQRYNADLDLED